MKLFRYALIPFLLAPFTAVSHEYWIAPAQFFPAEGEQFVIKVCEGHDFSVCENFEFPDTFTGLRVTGPDGALRELALATTEDGSAVTEWSADVAGRYAFTVQLMMSHRRRGDIPLYTTRAEVQVPGDAAQAPPPGIGQGLEILLVEDLAADQADDRVTLRALHDGRPAQTALQIQPDEGRRFSINTNRDGEATLRLTGAERYLIYATHQGVNGAVSFAVPD